MSESDPEATFVPISPNPYIVGNPVRNRSMFFGREAEFEMVRSRFQSAERGGGLLVFCGERRSGKTSILFQILDKRLGPSFIPVLIDMQSMAISTEADFLGKIAQEVLDALGDRAEGIPFPDFSPGTNHVDVFKKFIESTLRRCPDRKLILLFDEYELFENKIDSGVLSRDVLFILNNLMENQSVFLVFTGSQHLDQRRREYWRILGASIWKQISYLEPSDARKLICNPVEGRVSYAERTVDAIYRLSAGQPFYTQALCQSLVDLLNERKSHEVTHELLGEVVRGLVSNPLPQMIFLWDSLENDEKLTLAVLAEALPDDKALASDAALAKLIRSRKYPLNVNRSRVATALESLFRAELLAKDDSAHPPSYAFRMDLWRLWIRRMHSAWQVMRELGLDIRPSKTFRIGALSITRLQAASIAGVLAVAAAGLIFAPFLRRQGADRLTNPIGSTGPINHFGATESTQVSPGLVGPDSAQIAQFGRLYVNTVPSGAQISVDGTAHGRSPVVIENLRLETMYDVEATLPGHDPVSRSVQLKSDPGFEKVTLALSVSKAVVVLTSDPAGAVITVDDVNRGTTTLQLAGIVYGVHRFTARLAGYMPVVDSSLDVSGATGVVHFTLAHEPGGELVIKGDKSAEFYLDERLVSQGVPNSGILPVPSGSYKIKVVLGSGPLINKLVVVKSGERITFDFSDGTVTSSAVRKTP